MSLTAKGQPLNKTQIDTARALLQVAQTVSAPAPAAQACIFDAIFESDLGLDLGPNSAGYGGVLGGATSVFGDVHSSLTSMATSFFQGGNGFQAGGAIAASGKYQNVAVIGSQVTAAIPFDSQGISTQYESQTSSSWTISDAVREAVAIVNAYGKGTLTGGGSFGTGGTGTPGNTTPTSIWTVGDPSNPDQDYWTTINQYSMSAQWYAFTDAETLFVADGIQLMAQQPADVINRLDPNVISLRATWDNPLMLSTPIPTPDGWTTMGDVQVGDYVFGADGRPTRVEHVSPVFFGRECYMLRFSDGSAFVADGSHCWETVSLRRDAATIEDIAHQRYRGVRTTEEIFNTQRVPGGHNRREVANHRVKVASPLELRDQDLPVDPYILGAWLGDGDSRAPLFTCAGEDVEHLIAQIERAGYEHNAREKRSSGFSTGMHWRVSVLGITGALRDLGVLDNKHIPTMYLRSSAAQRLALLQGLMDTDGSVGRHCCFCVADKRLARNVRELVHGLGFRSGWVEKPARGISKPQFCVNFATRPHVNVFRLPRKADRYTRRLASKANRGGAGWRTITSVDRAPSLPVRCIAVANEDHLFLAGEAMIPTRNTTWQYTHTHTRRGRIQRRTSLAKITSPTQVTCRIMCNIDKYRAGDTVVLALCGPADGPWLIGDCTRSIYDPFSDLTLVQAMSPINAATGLPGGTPFLTGKQASRPSAGTVISAMISEAATINNDDYPYVWGGGHGSAGKPSVGQPGGNGFDGHTIGFDCSGAVAAVLAAGGLWPWGSGVPGDYGVIQQLLSQNKIVPGQGSGSPECTLFDNPGVHIFMRLNGQFFGTEDGAGHLPNTSNQGAGWIPNGSPGSFRAYHVPQAILGQQAAATPTA